MARRRKEGFDYFSLDCNFFMNRKIRRICKRTGDEISKFILIALLALIYGGKGYYIKWDKNTSFDAADYTGSTEEQVKATVMASIDADFFDKEMYEKYSILTSRAIQEQYEAMKTTSNKRWTFPDDAPYVLGDILHLETVHNTSDDDIMHQDSVHNPSENEFCTKSECKSTQSKVKKSKVKEIKVKESKHIGARFCPPTIEEAQAYITDMGYTVDANAWFNYYTANGWKVGKNSMKDWRASIRYWNTNSNNNSGTRPYARTDKKQDAMDAVNYVLQKYGGDPDEQHEQY